MPTPRPRGVPISATLTAAERARTVMAGASSLRMGVLDDAHEVVRHAVCPDGSLLFVAPPDSPARVLGYAGAMPAQRVVATALDVAAVPMPDRIRGRVKLSGRLGRAPEHLPAGVREHLLGPGGRPEPNEPVLLLTPTAVHLEWFCEPTGTGAGTEIPLADYRAASPDALVAHEVEWLPHLFHDHADVLRPLARAGEDDDVRPLAIDRFGLVLRSHSGESHVDVRLSFDRPVQCACEVRAAFLGLLRHVEA